MAEDLKTKVLIGGDVSGLTAAFTDAAAVVRDGAGQITDGFGAVGGALDLVSGKLLALSAGLGAVAGFAEFVKSTTDLGTSVRGLALALGETPEQASVMKAALASIGASTEGYTGALDHLARQIKQNEDGINALGIATRNADGTTRDSQVVMTDALRAVQQYKPGLDQTQAAMYLFGRSVAEVRELMPLLNLSMDEQKAKAQALGLVLSGEQVAAVNRYKLALNESKEVVEGAFNAIGEKLIPILTEAAKGFADIGPQIVKVAAAVGGVLVEGVTAAGEVFAWLIGAVKDVWASLSAFFDALTGNLSGNSAAVIEWAEIWNNIKAVFLTVADVLKNTVIIAIDEVTAIVRLIVRELGTLGQVVMDLAHNQWGKAWEDMKEGQRAAGQDMIDSFHKLVAEAGKAGEDIGRDMLSGYNRTKPKPSDITDPFKIQSGTKGFTKPETGTDTAGKDAILQAQLAGEVAIVKEYTAAEEKELARHYKEGLLQLKDYYAQRVALQNVEIDTEIAATERMAQSAKARESAGRSAGNDKEVNAALAEEIQLETKLTILRQKRVQVAQTAAEEEADAERKLATEIATARNAAQQKAALDALDSQRAIIKAEAEAGQISRQQAIDAFRNIEKQKYDIAVEFAEKRAALEVGNAAAQAQLEAKKAELFADYQKRDTEIAVENIKARHDLETSMLKDIQSDFATALDDIATKHKSLTAVISQFYNQLFAQMSKLASQEVANSLFGANPTAGSGGGASGGGMMSGLFGAIGSLFSSGAGQQESAAALVGVFASGTPFVPRTGLAMVHQGERVLTRQENLENGGSTINVHNNFNVQGETTFESRAAIASTVGRSLQAARRNL